ncbi:MAG: ATP-binding cassette domain-containing protein [Phycisphaerae bacterium]|nr:ATP-binding cassette domain-containing protein [Phycisphaerae bacterium]
MGSINETYSGPDRSGALLRMVGLRKSFGGLKVLDDFSLDIPEAKTTVIMGPSGCGKSVTLKHMVGLLKPDAGEIYFDGRRIDQLDENDLAPVRLQIGLLFQMSALFDSMTVAENIEFPLIEHTSMTRSQRAVKIAEALSRVDLAGAEKKLPSELSGGQRKRIALARAIVLRPRVVLYDEPTTGLDPIRADGINELILRLNRTLGVTNVVVTHDLVSAQKVADRVVVMLEGRIVADGTYAQVARHEDRRVQNFLAGRYVRDDDADERRLAEETRAAAARQEAQA